MSGANLLGSCLLGPLQLGEEVARIHWMGLRLRGQRMREIFEVCTLSLRGD
jgi:hypothetical protein